MPHNIPHICHQYIQGTTYQILINSQFYLVFWTLLTILFFPIINNLNNYALARFIDIVNNFFHEYCPRIQPKISTISPFIYRPTAIVSAMISANDSHWHMFIWLYSLQISTYSVFILIYFFLPSLIVTRSS